MSTDKDWSTPLSCMVAEDFEMAREREVAGRDAELRQLWNQFDYYYRHVVLKQPHERNHGWKPYSREQVERFRERFPAYFARQFPLTSGERLRVVTPQRALRLAYYSPVVLILLNIVVLVYSLFAGRYQTNLAVLLTFGVIVVSFVMRLTSRLLRFPYALTPLARICYGLFVLRYAHLAKPMTPTGILVEGFHRLIESMSEALSVHDGLRIENRREIVSIFATKLMSARKGELLEEIDIIDSQAQVYEFFSIKWQSSELQKEYGLEELLQKRHINDNIEHICSLLERCTIPFVYDRHTRWTKIKRAVVQAAPVFSTMLGLLLAAMQVALPFLLASQSK